MAATSPIAKMEGSDERKPESTFTPPRRPSASPQPRASPSRGTTPAATTTIWTSTSLGSEAPAA